MIVLFFLAAYLLGSIPFGLMAGYFLKGIDIREHGSKNIGATNVFRTVGKKWGITVLFLDALKGWIACLLPHCFGIADLPTQITLLLGVAAILGHTFPVWLKFKGGKGVATSLGVFLAICWEATVATFGIWILALLITRIISMASIVAVLTFPVIVAFFYWGNPDVYWLLPISIFLGAFILYTHRSNISRLRQGIEKKIF